MTDASKIAKLRGRAKSFEPRFIKAKLLLLVRPETIVFGRT